MQHKRSIDADVHKVNTGASMCYKAQGGGHGEERHE